MLRPVYKIEGVNRTKTVRFYPFVLTGEERNEETCYGYCNEYQPHAVKRMFDHENGLLYDMRWDEAGNLGQVSMGRPGEMFEKGRFLFWTEDCCGCEHRLCQSNVVSNRMHAAVDDKYFSYYVYDHSGERRLKLTGDSKLLDVCQRLRTPQNKLNEVSNADLMATYTVLNEPTLYPSAYMVLSNKGYTKHYYAGTERVAARLGGGGLDAQQHVIAIDDELQWRADKLFKQSLEQVNYRVLGENDLDCIMRNKFSPEVLGEWIDGIPYLVRAEVAVDNGQFKDMIHSMLDDPNNGKEKEVYFYHSDHLGSASWITDANGKPVQHLQYLPFGEPYVNQHPAGYQERYTFTGKERDEETGYGYFGARYMDHELMTMWLSVDPMSDKYPSISPYAYCAWNPVKLVDPDGREIWILTDKYNSNSPRVKWTENGLFNEDGSKYEGSDDFVLQTAQALDAIYGDNQMLLSQFMGESEYDISISETYGNTEYNKSVGGTEKYGYSLQKEQPIVFNPTMGLAQCKGDAENEEYLAPFLCLLHEFGHAYNAVTDHKGFCDRVDAKTGDAYSNKEEQFVIQNYEQPAAAKHGMLQRTSHIPNYDGLRIIQTEGPLSSKPIRK